MNKKLKTFLLSSMVFLSIGAITSCKKIDEGNVDIHITVSYIITFNSNGGSSVESLKVASGTKATKPADPTKEGYTFKGWYKNSTLTEEFDFENGINENITLYAKWEEVSNPVTTYKVTFNSNGGSSVTSQDINSGSKVTKPTDPTKEGYTFAGWYKNEGLTESYDFNTAVTSALTLYAKWEAVVTPPATYTVTFNSNGGTTVTTQTINSGAQITEPSAPTKNGYTFDCWCTDEALQNEFDVNTPITESITLYARWNQEVSSTAISITSATAGNETAVVEFAYNADLNDKDFSVYYSTDKTNYTKVESQLVSYANNKGKAYLVGLKADNYYVKIAAEGTAETKISSVIQVSEQDRSGYAHFNYNEGIGAYNNDGTLKTGAVVVYVNDGNKNTVTAEIGGKTYTGLANILKAATTGTPVDVRIIGTINAATWKPLSVSNYSAASATTVQGANGSYLELKNYDEADIISGGFNELDTSKYSKLNGLSNKIKYDSSKKEFDSYYNMLDISNAKNVTVEGIGEDARLFQWGFTWKSCTSIEVKNLTFDAYTEDACSFEGGDDSTTLSGFKTGHLWIHNNTFKKGVNYWDVCSEQDKHDGDGATDFKKLAYVTVSYNHYIENHKTGLVGGSDTQHTACLTFHHNFYDQCQSRLPFARQANMHMYNNYYYNSTGNNMQIYAGAFAFIENCYFKNTKNTFTLKTSDGKVAAVKSFNNIYDSCSSSGATIVSSRIDTVTNGNLYGQSFDTNSSIFYYDSTNQKSKVSILNDVEDVPTFTVAHAGAGASYYNSLDLGVVAGTKYEVTFKKYINNTETTISTNLVLEGSSVSKPTDPTLDGYEFKGWYTDNTFTTEYNFSNAINSDTSIYAKFEAVEQYTISYKYNIGADDFLITSAKFNENQATVAPTNPTLSGYEFKGWFTDKTYNTAFTFGDVLIEDVTVYAKFEVKVVAASYEISFNDLTTGSKSNTTIDLGNATIIAGSGGISISSQNNTCGTFASTKYLDLQGGGSKTNRALSFELTETSNVTVYLGSTANRHLKLSNGTEEIGDATTQSGVSSHTFENVPAGTYYLYSGGSEIKIYYVLIEEISNSSNPTVNNLSLNMYSLSRDNTNTSHNNGQYTTKYVKTIYKAGDAFDSTNLTAVADDTRVALSDLTVTGFASTEGMHTITVSYGGASETYDVYVLPQTLNNLNVAVGSTYTVGGTTEINAVTYVTFKTIEQALEYLRSFVTPTSSERANLYISAGYYNEKVVIDVPYLTITGAGKAKATYASDSSYNKAEYDAATIIEWNSLYGVEEQGFTNVTDSTQTVYVKESALYCEIKNLTISNANNCYSYFENVVKSQAEHRALALLVQADHFIMNDCSLLGYQDTVEFFTGRSYLNNCYITGATDYIFGTNATVYIKDSIIHTIYNGSNTQGGWVNVFKGENVDSTDAITYGVIYDACVFEADSNVADGTVSLGRPWAASEAVMIMNSEISAKYSTAATTSASAGRYTDWNSTILATNAKFYEYNNTGLGAISASVTGCKVLTDSIEAAKYNTFSVIFGKENGNIAYNDNWDGTTTPEVIDYSAISSTVGLNFKNYSNVTNSINFNTSDASGYKITSTDETTILWTTFKGCQSNGGIDNNWLQLSNGATITFAVSGPCTINLVLYNGTTMNVALGENVVTADSSSAYTSDSTKYVYTITQAGTIKLTATGGYLGLIEIIF